MGASFLYNLLIIHKRPPGKKVFISWSLKEKQTILKCLFVINQLYNLLYVMINIHQN